MLISCTGQPVQTIGFGYEKMPNRQNHGNEPVLVRASAHSLTCSITNH